MIEYTKLNILHCLKLYYFLKNNNSEFFHPHKFNMWGIIKVILSNKNDVYKILLDDDNNIIGYGMLRGWDEGYDVPSLGIIIDKKYHGSGLSKNMMKHLTDIAIERKCEKIILKVSKKNYKAIGLYKSLGYELSDTEFDYMKGEKLL